MENTPNNNLYAIDGLTHVEEELDQLAGQVRDLARSHYDLQKVRQHIEAAMKIIRKCVVDLGTSETESLDLSDLRIVENAGSTLESMDDDCEILGIPLNLDEACAFDFSKHIDAIIGSEDARAADSKKHQQLNQAQSNQQEYDRRYKEMPRDRIKFKR